MSDLSHLSDAELLQGLKRWANDERRSQARVIDHLAEFDARELYAKVGFPSLFLYCQQEMGYSEAASYRRIQAARAVRKFPAILERLEFGRIHLSAVATLAPHFTQANHLELLTKAEGMKKIMLEALAASFHPKPDKRDRVMRLPDRGFPPASGASGETPQFAVEPPSASDFALGASPSPGPRIGPSQKIEVLSPERVHFGFTGGQELRRKLDRAKELLWHKAPAGRLEDIIGAVLDFYLERRDPALRSARQDAAGLGPAGKGQPGETSAKSGDSPPPGKPGLPGSRRIPQAVKDAVWRRDGGRCAYAAAGGRRCDARAGLEYDHILPWAFGGDSSTVDNVRLLCRTHNQRAARELGLFRPTGPQPEPPHRRPSA